MVHLALDDSPRGYMAMLFHVSVLPECLEATAWVKREMFFDLSLKRTSNKLLPQFLLRRKGRLRRRRTKESIGNNPRADAARKKPP